MVIIVEHTDVPVMLGGEQLGDVHANRHNCIASVNQPCPRTLINSLQPTSAKPDGRSQNSTKLKCFMLTGAICRSCCAGMISPDSIYKGPTASPGSRLS